MRPSFPPSGYAIVSLQLETTTIDALLAEARTRTYTPVFREVGGASDDPFRSQSRAVRMTSTLRVAAKSIQEEALVRDERYVPCVFSYMHSRPGGAAQEAHQDYTAEVRASIENKFPGTLPASVIVALEENTRLPVFTGCFEYPSARKEVVLSIPRGYAIVFRGDLFHSGVAFSTSNYRLHCYLFFRGEKWIPDVVFNTFLCANFAGTLTAFRIVFASIGTTAKAIQPQKSTVYYDERARTDRKSVV